MPKELWILSAWLVVRFALDYYGSLIAVDSQVFAYIIDLGDYTCFSIIFYLAFDKRKLKKLVAVISLISIIFYIVMIFLNAENLLFNVKGAFCFAISLFIYCFIMYRQLLTKQAIVFIDRVPVFWITNGILILTAGSFIPTMAGNYLEANNDLLKQSWQITNISNIVACACYSIAILCYKP